MMGLVSDGLSSIIVSSMSVSFWGEIVGDLTATLFFVTVPLGLFVGVRMVGTGFGMLQGDCCPTDLRVVWNFVDFWWKVGARWEKSDSGVT